MNKLLSIVATYKNRRHHIEQTLETWIQKNVGYEYEIIIVDYESEDDIGPLLEKLNSSTLIKHVRCTERPVFNLSHARNIGVNHAIGKWVLFVDVDCKLVSESMLNVGQMISSSHECYFGAVDSSVRKDIINGGLMMVETSKHMDICGFNEHMQGWGFEDIDYRQRLETKGLTWKLFPPHLYDCIDHDDDERTGCYSIDKELSWMKNRQISLSTWYDIAFGEWTKSTVKVYGV